MALIPLFIALKVLSMVVVGAGIVIGLSPVISPSFLLCGLCFIGVGLWILSAAHRINKRLDSPINH